MSLLLDAVKHEMKEQNGLELRLYVHKDIELIKMLIFQSPIMKS
ncbi:hypothetical protein VAEKB19_7330001 [Vibrio aestuarianus]|nr:hypothetical protein VAEKB19_7330001 [Vibrio aestuarianus]